MLICGFGTSVGTSYAIDLEFCQDLDNSQANQGQKNQQRLCTIQCLPEKTLLV